MVTTNSAAKARFAASVGRLFNVLVHKVRTPLSVVTNDLFYLGSLLPNENVARTSRRAHEVQELLHQVEAVVGAPLLQDSNSEVWLGSHMEDLIPLVFPASLGWIIEQPSPTELWRLSSAEEGLIEQGRDLPPIWGSLLETKILGDNLEVALFDYGLATLELVAEISVSDRFVVVLRKGQA